MYCNKCGKELPAESLFCPFCGRKQEVIASSHDNDNAITPEQVIEDKSIQSTQSNDKTKAGSIADEIIANLKMVGLAVLLCLLYIGVFWIYHIDDRKPISNFQSFGSSCYDDPSMPSYYELDEEQLYLKNKSWKEYIEQRYEESRGLLGVNSSVEEAYRKYVRSDAELMNQAKEEASRNREQMFSDIYEHRLFYAKEDFKKHLKYGILISFALTIFGRYLIIGIKWVAKNKTK